jgi:cell division protein ZapA
MPSADVYILGQKYTIKGDASRKHIETLADDVNRRIKEVLDKAPNIPLTKALILAMFNMADELKKLGNGGGEIEHLEKKAEELAKLFD